MTKGWGKIMFVTEALEFERPFLAQLYEYIVMHPRSSVRKVPPYVAFFLQYGSQQVAKKMHHDCAILDRLTAQASRTRKGLEGWLPAIIDGKIDLWSSRWFSREIKLEDIRWVIERGGEPSRVISTLEALAVLINLKIFFGDGHRWKKTKVQVVPTWTDKRW